MRAIRTTLAACVGLSIALAHGSPPPVRAANVSTQQWLQGWPMQGHDPQRSSLSPVTSTSHPHLLLEQPAFTASLIAADGSIIGLTNGPAFDLASLSPAGILRHLHTHSDPPVAVRRDGTIIAMGGDDAQAQAFSPGGKLLWRNRRLGFLKGAIPLVAADNRLFAPCVGHTYYGTAGLYVLTSHGKLVSHVIGTESAVEVARSPDGTVFVLAYDDANGGEFVAALSPSLRQTWRRYLGQLDQNGGDRIMVGQNGALYVTAGDSLLSIDSMDHVLWTFTKSDGALSMAERPDGVILVAGHDSITAVSSQGTALWSADISSQSPQQDVSAIVVDHAGTAYAGTADGMVRIIAADGHVLGTLDGGGFHDGRAPAVLLGPQGHIVVNGSDGTLRLYG